MITGYRSLFLLSLFSLVLFSACTGNKGPVSADKPTWQTAYGTVTQIADYPLFSFTYSGDYQFDSYLETGNIPVYAITNQKNKNFTCTCFTAFGAEGRLLGRNYDWPEQSTYYLVFTNPPQGYAAVSTVDMYFFNYHHDQTPDYEGNQDILRTIPFYPFDGMNEKGVAVGMNALPAGRGPYDSEKVTIGELQLIRLVLDYAASTREAVTLIQQYNIRMEDPPIHYLIADSMGHSVIIEFSDGNMYVMENQDPWQVTTNFVISDYSDPLEAPCWRYRDACQTLETANGSLSQSEAYGLLQNVSVPSTRWTTLFNLKTGQLQISMGRSWDNLHFFNLY